MHRKGWGTCRSTKSCNLSLDCPPCLTLFKTADMISMSQRASASTPRSNEPAIYLKPAMYPQQRNVEKNDRNRLHFITGVSLRLNPGNLSLVTSRDSLKVNTITYLLQVIVRNDHSSKFSESCRHPIYHCKRELRANLSWIKQKEINFFSIL